MPTPASLQLKSLPDDETLAVLADRRGERLSLGRRQRVVEPQDAREVGVPRDERSLGVAACHRCVELLSLGRRQRAVEPQRVREVRARVPSDS
jgi:hypothetical protein